MNYSQELLEKLQEKTGASQRGIAKLIGKSQGYLSQVKNGETHLSDELGLVIGEILEIEDTVILTKLNQEKAKSEREKKAWAKLLVSTAATGLLMMPAINMIAYNVYLRFRKGCRAVKHAEHVSIPA